jgi:SAM-dependent methyltransferase
MKLVSPPESITHLHLLNAVVTEIIGRNLGIDGPVRILDAGCGNGHLAGYIYNNLSAMFPEHTIEVHGYDVGDHGVQEKDFFSDTLTWCKASCPDVPWEERLKLIRHDEEWPFTSSFFDLVVSNQVLEHVWDHGHFFSENYRVLKEGGSGVHLFPLKHYVYEGHLLLPFVHRISDWHVLKSYIALLSRIGLGKYRDRKDTSIDEFSERHADYMTFYTNYLGYSELMAIVKRCQLRPSLKYTPYFYLHKLSSIFRKNAIIDLKKYRSGKFCGFVNHALKYVSSITLFVEKKNTYGRP